MSWTRSAVPFIIAAVDLQLTGGNVLDAAFVYGAAGERVISQGSQS
jgi:hypothetical protein